MLQALRWTDGADRALVGTLLLTLGVTACPRSGHETPTTAPDPIAAAACAGRPGCELRTTLLEPPAPDGTRTEVVLISLGKAPRRPGPSIRAHWPALGHEAGDLACVLWELRLVRTFGRETARGALLISDCTRDTGERPPMITQGERGQVSYTPEPSDGRDALDLALDPPSVQRETHVDGARRTTWSYKTFRGEGCERDDCVPALPDVPVADATFARTGWKTTGLGECAMLVDGQARGPNDTSRGVVSGGRATAALHLLLSEGTLYLEVEDDVFITQGPVVDTLDLRSSFSEATPGERPLHERLRMDGTLLDHAGHVRQLELAVTPTSRRFALRGVWPLPFDVWDVTYEDTDDGHSLVRLSTGAHGLRSPPTFSSPIPCVAEAGVLRPLRKQPASLDEPLAP